MDKNNTQSGLREAKTMVIDLLDEGVTHEPGRVGKERDDDDVDVADAGGDGIRPVEERDAAQRAHGHGYSWTLVALETIDYARSNEQRHLAY